MFAPILPRPIIASCTGKVEIRKEKVGRTKGGGWEVRGQKPATNWSGMEREFGMPNRSVVATALCRRAERKDASTQRGGYRERQRQGLGWRARGSVVSGSRCRAGG